MCIDFKAPQVILMQLVQLQKEPFGLADRSQPPRAQNSKKKEKVCVCKGLWRVFSTRDSFSLLDSIFHSTLTSVILNVII